eukprot:TRINITY_DN22677_c0_g1_i2.p2 TRINITY_DN22677_c0_g1~~TRINITY_DN22677_c0_g1_i2.p2  ORF type:complete len:263 (-),score=53.43 TRINITY_DN22677_c0_g1_i2:23-730(-)
MPINFDWFDLSPYANKWFVETGLFHGEGAMKALSSGAFEKVMSVEINRDLVELARERLRLPIAAGLLQIVHADSAQLGAHIEGITEPITFFLDAHGHWVRERRCAAGASCTEGEAVAGASSVEAGAEAAHAPGARPASAEDADADPSASSACPLLLELEAIRRHPLARRHTVLIDDRRCLQPDWDHPTQSWWKGLCEEDVLQKLREINPDFEIRYLDGLVPGDVIAAIPPKGNSA